MKKIVTLMVFIISIASLNAQQTFIISSSGFNFNPANVIVNQGDIVRFGLSAAHPVIEVSQTTWNANGTTPLAGGFSFPSGSGDFTAVNAGTFYFVCQNHAGSGMKGSIVVNLATGLSDINDTNKEIIFPNPSTDYLIFRSKINSSVNEVKILDLSGKVVSTIHVQESVNNQLRIDVRNLVKGIYLIQVKSESGTISRKFIKS